MGLSAQSVAELAGQCIDRFEQALEVPALANNQWAENRRADFKLWVDGVGARARKRASLDERLESREHELALIKTILLNLKSYLGRCLTAREGKPLGKAKLDVDVAIDNLALIAVAIRRTGQRSRLLRADRSFDRTTLVELEMYLTCMALLRRTSLKEEAPKQHKADPACALDEKLPEHIKQHYYDPVWWQSEIEDVLTPLQERLIEANLRRRNRFLYAQRHSNKLAIPHKPAKEPVDNPTVLFQKEVSSPTQTEAKTRKVSDDYVREAEKSTVSPPLSLTRASDIDSNLELEELKIPIQAPMTQITSITGATEYPKLRKPPVEKSTGRGIEQTKIQKCPCCCEPLRRGAVASKNAWK
ncbi:hypothetical protein B0J13DRAFT_658468 [Dactylonectria estremocensis]|uniref:Uncharacterized protein n=1 Tax=Dactylonectria estremocensis TaxID=1079267 RepID=A0A9P9J5S0_9HYPO|nr:hypothetical protein B0J13DRAFT_658468 [Dactylonectria estremocensis]